MKYRKRLAALVVIGLAAGVVSPAATNAATKKKATKKTVKTATTKPAAATTAPAATPAAATPAAAKSGGKMVWGIGAESNGWLPATQNWSIEGGQVSVSVIERLIAIDDKGDWKPWLLESMVPNSSYTNWTMTIRKGIKFHNGETLNADAVAANLASVRAGFITANVFLNLAGACVVESEYVVSCPTKKPWVSLPFYFAGSAGAIVAPAQIKANDAKSPIGTGPFVFKEWVPNVKFVATKNPNYWQKGLPKADEIEFRQIISDDARLAQLQSGQIDYSQSATGAAYLEYEKLAKDKKIKLYLNEGPTAINYDLLNNALPPFNNRDCRLAAAQALDMETLIKLRAPGFDVANGPFAKGTVGYLADNGYPKYNLDAAKASFEKCKAGGPQNTSFTMATTTSPEAIETRNVKKQMVERAGFTIKTVEIPQDSYIPAALVGSFQWQTWRNHGGVDPDTERIWWASETAIAAPGIALNFGRVKDNNIDAALDQIRASSDPVVKKRAAEIVNTTFADQVYAIWNWPSKYILGTCNSCSGFTDTKLPDGDKAMPNLGGITGLNYLTGKQ
jgi:peptide/nickel transport system substrate-binding protein